MRDTRAMVLPEEIATAAGRGQLDAVRNWLDENSAHDVHDRSAYGDGFLTLAGGCLHLQNGNALIAFLLARGVDVNQRALLRRPEVTTLQREAVTTLHNVCFFHSPGGVELLVSHGADVNALTVETDQVLHSPLSFVAGSRDHFMAMGGDMARLSHKAWLTGRTLTTLCRDIYSCIVLLLRAGAALDGQAAGGTRPEAFFDRRIGDIPPPEHPDFLPKMELKRSRDLLAAVRAAGGTWRKWTLVPPKQVLVLRSLIARDRARVKATTPRRLAWLMSPHVPNEIAWRVLAYWNPRPVVVEERLRTAQAQSEREQRSIWEQRRRAAALREAAAAAAAV